LEEYYDISLYVKILVKLLNLNLKHVILLFVVAQFSINGLKAQTRKARKAEKNAEKIEHFQKIFYQKARKKAVKERRKMQQEETQKRMEEADKRAKRFNRDKKVLFFIRFVKKRKAKK
jgi:hypothetical protein